VYYRLDKLDEPGKPYSKHSKAENNRVVAYAIGKPNHVRDFTKWIHLPWLLDELNGQGIRVDISIHPRGIGVSVYVTLTNIHTGRTHTDCGETVPQAIVNCIVSMYDRSGSECCL
jgi:hypothetical protein